jgi:hypothetical protein
VRSGWLPLAGALDGIGRTTADGEVERTLQTSPEGTDMIADDDDVVVEILGF